MKNMKGQAAMEYLMTYGWAILAIVLVIAALIFMNPFRAPEVCLFEQAGFTCNEPPPQLYVDQGGDLMMNVKMWNQVGQPITVRNVLCTSAPGSEVPAAAANHAVDANNYQLQTGASFQAGGDNSNMGSIPCVDSLGNAIKSSSGQEFRGKLVVWYNYANDIDPSVKHQIKANVISKVAG